MRNLSGCLPALLIVAAELSGQARVDATQDTLDYSPHSVRMVQVHGARLQLLDWGGKGQVVMFMPGYGDSAHIFDDFAPALTDRFHVVGLTPRGFPPSNAPDAAYTIAQLSDDAAAILDSLGATAAILAGHSMSGAVITQFGATRPTRLIAAVYLDAAFDFGPAFARGRRPGRPAPPDTTAPAYRAWQARYSDSLLSPSIIAAVHAEERALRVDRADAVRRSTLVAPLANEVRSRPHQPWTISAPSLSICAAASFDRVLGWITPDSTRWKQAKAFYDDVSTESRVECERLGKLSKLAKVVSLDSGHYIFIDARDRALSAVRAFLETMPRGK